MTDREFHALLAERLDQDGNYHNLTDVEIVVLAELLRSYTGKVFDNAEVAFYREKPLSSMPRFVNHEKAVPRCISRLRLELGR